MDWYTLRVISGREKKIKDTILYEVSSSDSNDQVSDVLVPSENIVEMRDGKKKVKERVFFPGYLLIRMEMNKESRFLLENVNGVISFVGPKGKPQSLRPEEAQRFLGDFDGVVVHNTKLGSASRSLQKQITMALDVPSDEWVYMCEDDYLHSPKAFKYISEFIKNKEKIISLFEELEFRNLLQRVLSIDVLPERKVKNEMEVKNISNTSDNYTINLQDSSGSSITGNHCAVNSTNIFILSDSTYKIYKFSLSNFQSTTTDNATTSWGSGGTGSGQYMGYGSIIADENYVYISSRDGSGITKFDTSGNVIKHIGSPKIRQIYFNPSNSSEIFDWDFWAGKFKIYDTSLNELKSTAGVAYTNTPGGDHGLSADSNGNIYISGYHNDYKISKNLLTRN